jgi:hypothetical protein
LISPFQLNLDGRKANPKTEVRQTKTELKNEIDGLKADLSQTASRTELEEVKAKLN